MPTTRRSAVTSSGVLLAAFALPACMSVSDPPEVCPGDRCVEEVRLRRGAHYLAPGDTTRLGATVTVRGGLPTTFVWRSDQPAVATVDAQGLVTARAPGVAAIRVLPTADSSRFVYTVVQVTGGDSSGVPVILSVTDAATGRAISDTTREVGDSVDVLVEYVAGRLTGQAIDRLAFRLTGGSGGVAVRDTVLTLPVTARPGEIGRATLRLRPNASTGPAGGRFLPVGAYQVLTGLFLSDGRTVNGFSYPALFVVPR